MPEIASFGKLKIVMYFADENPPHVHVLGPGFSAKLRIADAKLIAGSLPPKAAREAADYVRARKAELLSTWLRLKG